MYLTDNGLEIYETLEELIKKGVELSWEDLSKLYVCVRTEVLYDNSIWVVDKESKEVSWMFYTDFITDIEIRDDVKPIDPESLKRYL